jgi:hypothetical protein
MGNSLLGMVILISAAPATVQDTTYEGSWVTTNRKLDGTMTCVVTDLGDTHWRGHFYGVWQGVQFAYTVRFSGPSEKLQGTAVIDGADYEWTGEMGQKSPGWFKGSFGGSRYIGSFNLKQKSKIETGSRR